jgi:predicted nucleic acid-binding protein
MDTVYLETTFVGHLAGRLHPDAIVAARQLATRKWWTSESARYILYVSQLVLDECASGDPSAASERLQEIQSLDLLAATLPVDELAKDLIAGNAIPSSEPRDAFHVAIAAVHGMNYLLTWNFKHIANAALRHRIEEICRDVGYEPPVICTPDELMGTENVS